MRIDAELSRLVVEYTGYERYATPSCSWTRVEFSAENVDPKRVRAVQVVGLVNSIEIAWDGKSLQDGADEARAVIAEIHPELTDTALDALAWLFSYEWK